MKKNDEDVIKDMEIRGIASQDLCFLTLQMGTF
jgi:hypothetical protein